MVVAAASGPVEATVGQIGKIMGCCVAGIVGGPVKCAHEVDNPGFDICIDHKADGFAAALKQGCGHPHPPQRPERMTKRGFIVFDDFGHLHDEFAGQMQPWVKGAASNTART